MTGDGNVHVEVEEEREVLLEADGACKINPRSGWRPCHAVLDGGYLVIERSGSGRRDLFISTDRISGVELKTVSVVLRRRKVILASYLDEPGEKEKKIWLMVPVPEIWKERVEELSIPPLKPAELEKACEGLKPLGECILRHLWERGHADIRELAEMSGEENHMEILASIREDVNPRCEESIGRPLLEFCHAKTEPVSGEKAAFSWWIRGKPVPRRDPVLGLDIALDVFDEDDCFLVIVDVPGLEEDQVRVDCHDGRLALEMKTEAGVASRTFELPAGADTWKLRKRLNNGILEIKIPKDADSSAGKGIKAVRKA